MGGKTFYGAAKIHLEKDNIFGFIEWGQSTVEGDKSLDSLHKIYEDSNGIAGVSLVCMNALCGGLDPSYSMYDPLPATLASLLL